MDFIDQIKTIASRAEAQLDHLGTEEATKNALIMPFINTLGYNVFDPTEVVPEYTADVGVKKGEKVDYAIVIEEKPLILFECKHAGSRLSKEHTSQLYRYFSTTEARIGVLTNGVEYQLFSDLEDANKMDSRPFLEFDIRNISDSTVQELKKLSKQSFDLDQVLTSANELKYLRAMKLFFNQQLQEPSEEFIKFVIGSVYDGRMIQSVVDQFSPLVKRAFNQFVNERINVRLTTALVDENQIQVVSSAAEEVEETNGIITTEEELEAYHIVKAILREVVEVSRIAARDVKSYFGVLLDDNNRKPICRFHFNTSQKYLGLFDEERNEKKIPIASLEQIYDHASYLKKTAQSYQD